MKVNAHVAFMSRHYRLPVCYIKELSCFGRWKYYTAAATTSSTTAVLRLPLARTEIIIALIPTSQFIFKGLSHSSPMLFSQVEIIFYSHRGLRRFSWAWILWIRGDWKIFKYKKIGALSLYVSCTCHVFSPSPFLAEAYLIILLS